MALTKNDKIKLAAGGALVVIVLIWRFSGSDDQSKAAGSGPQTIVQKVQGGIQDVKSTISAEITTPKSKAVKVRYDNWGRDPFRDRNAVIPADTAAVELVIKGIVRRGNQMFVLINDLILTEGQEKDGLYIERIEHKSVFCRKGGRWFTLTWKEES